MFQGDDKKGSRSPATVRFMVAIFFFVSGFGFSSWASRIPTIQQQLHLNEAQLGAVLFAVIGWSDYLDGIAARVTGQYSRMGALLDPLVDRMLVISGVVVCWHFELLPRWALALLAARELFMIALARFALSRGAEIKINWLGRWGVWPVFGSLFFALI